MAVDELPRKLNKKEASITPKVKRWFLDNYKRPCAVEIKIKGRTPKPHQETSLIQASRGQFAYKPPDFGHQNPCDLIFLLGKNTDGILATCEKDGQKWRCLCEVYGRNTDAFEIVL